MQYAVLAQTVVNGPNGGYKMKAACLKNYIQHDIYSNFILSQNQAYQAVGIVGLNYVWSPKLKTGGQK